MNNTPPTQGLYEFVTVVEAGSVSAAARALGLPRATLSRRISALERDCGVRLLHRTTRKLTLTEAGDALYKRARRIIDDAREAWTTVRRLDDTPRGLLRISIPPTLGQDLLAPLLIKYARLYPEVRLEVMATTRHVDLIADRVDVALRAGTVRDPTLIVRRLWQMRASLVASPAYLARYGAPRDADALTHHHCIVGFERGELPQRAWPLRGGGEVRVAGRLAFNEPLLALIACVAGEGITLINRLMADPAIASGALVPLLEDEVGFEASLSVVYPSREQLEPKVRAFVDLICAELPDRRHDEAMRAHIEAVVLRASAL